MHVRCMPVGMTSKLGTGLEGSENSGSESSRGAFLRLHPTRCWWDAGSIPSGPVLPASPVDEEQAGG